MFPHPTLLVLSLLLLGTPLLILSLLLLITPLLVLSLPIHTLALLFLIAPLLILSLLVLSLPIYTLALLFGATLFLYPLSFRAQPLHALCCLSLSLLATLFLLRLSFLASYLLPTLLPTILFCATLFASILRSALAPSFVGLSLPFFFPKSSCIVFFVRPPHLFPDALLFLFLTDFFLPFLPLLPAVAYRTRLC